MWPALSLLFFLVTVCPSSASTDTRNVLIAIASSEKEVKTAMKGLQTHLDARLDQIMAALGAKKSPPAAAKPKPGVPPKPAIEPKPGVPPKPAIDPKPGVPPKPAIDPKPVPEGPTTCPLPFRKASPSLCLVGRTGRADYWYSARNTCRGVGGDLIVLRSDADYDAVRSFAKKTKFLFDDFWTALKREGRKLVWTGDPTNRYMGILRRADQYAIKPVRNCIYGTLNERRRRNKERTLLGAPCGADMGVICYTRPVPSKD